MKKRHNTLNEEINRIKSLFTEERLYGNIVEKDQIIAEALKKVLLKALKPASAALKSVDTKLLTNFLEAPLESFGDFVKHLDEFPTIWGKIIKDVKKLESAKNVFKYLENVKAGKHPRYKTLKDIPDDSWDKLTLGVTREAGLRDQFYDLMQEAKGVDSPIKDNTQRLVVKDDLSGTHIHVLDNDTGMITSYKLEDNGNLKPVAYFDNKKVKELMADDMKRMSGEQELKRIEAEKVDADIVPEPKGKTQAEIEAERVEAERVEAEIEAERVEAERVEKQKYADAESILDGDLLDLDDFTIDATTSFGRPVGTGNPRKVKKEALEVINLTIINASKKSPEKITLRQLMDHIKSQNGFVIVKMKNGKTRRVELYKEFEVKVTTIDGKEVVTGYTLKKEGTFGGSDSGSDGWFNKQIQKINTTKTQNEKMIDWRGGALRFLFPQTSWFLRKVTWPIRVLKIFPKLGSRKRYSFAPGPPIPKDYNDLLSSGVRKVELGVRIGVEQFFFVTAYGLYKQYERGDDISLNPVTNWNEFYNGEIYKYQPIILGYDAAAYLFSEDVFWEQLRNNCKIDCEESGIEPSKVLDSSCFKKCSEKVDKLKVSVGNSKDTLKNYSEVLKTVGDIGNMTDERRRAFCDGDERKDLKENLMEVKRTQKELKEKYKDLMGDGNIIVDTISEVIKQQLKTLGLMNDDDDVLLQDGDGNEVTISNIDEAINDIDEACDNLDNETYNDMPSDKKETPEEKAAREKREKEAKEKKKKNKKEGKDNGNIVFYAEATQFELIS